MPELDHETLSQAQERVSAMKLGQQPGGCRKCGCVKAGHQGKGLGCSGVGGNCPCDGEYEPMQSTGAASAEKTRRTRSDAGKPRETLYVELPGVRFNLGVSEGKDALSDYITALIAQGDATALGKLVDSLLLTIDRLRAK